MLVSGVEGEGLGASVGRSIDEAVSDVAKVSVLVEKLCVEDPESLSCAEVVGSAGEDMTGGQADDQISVWACIIAVVTLFEPGCALDSIIA